MKFERGWVGVPCPGFPAPTRAPLRGLASAQRVFDLADRVPAVEIDGGECPGDRAVGEVEFRDVWFKYTGRDKVRVGERASERGRGCVTGWGGNTLLESVMK